MVKKKGKSKRTTLKDKYKIQKRTVQTHRKNRKQAKKDAASGAVVQKKKDPGIPNTWPFKADLLKEIQRTRERQQAIQQSKKDQRSEQLRALRQHQAEGGTARTIEELAQLAAESQRDFEAASKAAAASARGASKDDGAENPMSSSLGQPSRRAYLRELKKVVDASDVLLQVLDARDPVGTRLGKMAEDAILSRTDKRMVLVLNKIDLVPKEAVGAWLAHLRKSHPTIALQANKVGSAKSTKGSGGNDAGENDTEDATVATAATTSNSNSSLTSGMDGLLQLLKNYARTSGGGKNSKSNIVVGVVGYPNTGKSSILRSLTQCRGSRQSIGVSPRPGFTTTLQEVVLDKQVRLLDSPGVVFDDSSALLCNCVDAESMDDPVAAVESMLQRCTHQSLVLTYNLPHFVPGNVDMFLALMAKKHGRVTKGGIPDKVAAARGVLRDWNSGKIPYYTTPPLSSGDGNDDEERRASAASAVIVSELGEDFLRKLDEQVLSGLTEDGPDAMDYLELQPTDRLGPGRRDNLNLDEEEEEDDDDAGSDDESDDNSDVEMEQESQDYDFDEMA